MSRLNLGTGGAVATMVASASVNQAGAALAARAFPAIGPAGVVAIRQLAAAAVLLPVARPNLRRMTWSQWWPALLLGLVFTVMNISLYTAVDRVGLGLAVTLEFLGPLTIALCGSRTPIDLVCAVVAGIGVYVLVRPGPSTDVAGLSLGLLAGACWAAYILLNRLIGARLPGLQGPAVGTAVAAVLYLPVAVVILAQGRFTVTALAYGLGAGVLCSVVPYAADVVALRRVPARFFGLVQSVHPMLAALAGAVILGQVPAAHVWAGIVIVVCTNAVAVAVAGTRAARLPEPLLARPEPS
ncbi:EamA family transporter [Dactylosporangium matsuzakiense]|uniref:Membrane protein n=1 Tax=Dactylosporangium matsuzakiense TaxID=53360 RepID=A0A9W6KK36_9ACTN|nr:EamA family transporter [Dactylosporangium matsuzakiense]GLL02437.1 membrane protein [Dactylosporangium matsuzakiense]